MRIRRLEPGPDVDAVVAFLARLESQTGVPPLGESKYVDLGGPRAGHGFIAERGEIAAYLHLLWHEASRLWELELAVDTDRITAPELEAMVTAAGSEASDRMLLWTFGQTGGAEFAAERFRVARELHKLVGALPPPEPPQVPDGFHIRPFRPGVDEDAWLEANNAAFAGHPENGDWTRAEIIERQSRDWFEAEGFRLSWVGDRVAAFCWTKRHSQDLGEIHVVAVHPEFQGRGIGRLIVIEALWYLAGVGCRTAMLYVDTANRSALDLYQSLGFGLERIDRCFEIPNAWPHEGQ